MADTIAAHLSIRLEDKQQILELVDLDARLEKQLGLMEGEIDLIQIENRIRGRVKRQMEKSQREYYLNEQMKAIHKELGELENAPMKLKNWKTKLKRPYAERRSGKKSQLRTHQIEKNATNVSRSYSCKELY